MELILNLMLLKPVYFIFLRKYLPAPLTPECLSRNKHCTQYNALLDMINNKKVKVNK